MEGSGKIHETCSRTLIFRNDCLLNTLPRRNILGRAAWIGSFVTSSLCPAIVEKNNHCITNKDRLCEERTTILSCGWTSPVFSLYKEISFFERWAGSAFLKNALFLRRGGALTCNRLKKNNYFIKVFSSCLNELQALAITKDYPGFHAVRRNPIITMGDLQQGHLKTGLGRCLIPLITTCKINCTRNSNLFALP